MKWKEVQLLSKSDFKRYTGVTPEVFHQMASAMEQSKTRQRKHPTRGRKSKLAIEDKILLLLMYYREYRTMFHIGMAYGVSEAVVCRTIKETESLLLHDKRFHLPGKKVLTRSENMFEVLLIDVAETPIERPKKNNADVIRAKRKDTP